MDPDVARALPVLVKRGILPAEKAPRLLRLAKGVIISVHEELRVIVSRASS